MKEFQLHQIEKEMKIEFQRKQRNFDGFENILYSTVLKTIFKEIENEQNVLCRAGCGLGCFSCNLAGNNTLPPAPYWI